MKLEDIFRKYGIELKDNDGVLRNPVDIIEDMYLRLLPVDILRIFNEIMEEEKFRNVFDEIRNRPYGGK